MQEPTRSPPRKGPHKLLVPMLLFASSMIMSLAWLGHLKFKEQPLALVIPLAWLVVLPEYALNIAALRRGYERYSGGQMAAFRLCSGVVCVALVSRFLLGEALSARKMVGFALMMVAMALISIKPKSDAKESAEGEAETSAASNHSPASAGHPPPATSAEESSAS